MNKCSLIVTDMDGTLLNESHTLTPYTIDVLKRAQAQGIGVLLASGRDYENLHVFGEELNLRSCPLSGYMTLNGLETYDYQGLAIIKHPRLSYHDILPFHDIVKRAHLSLLLFYENHHNILSYCQSIDASQFVDTKEYMPATFEDLSSFQQDALLKIVLFGQEEKISAMLDQIPEELKSSYEITMVEKEWVEVNPKGVDKARGLQDFMTYHHLPLGEVMVYGNGENDLTMLASAPHSFSPANALPVVLAQAHTIIEDNDHDEVAKHIETYLKALSL